MILAIDVKYNDNGYKTCGVLFESFTSKEPAKILSLKSDKQAAEYVPGEFYKRELPCIVEFLEYYKLRPEWLIVDGFCINKDNDGNIHEGLGYKVYKYIHNNLSGFNKTKVIGIAKSNYCRSSEIASYVCRGKSKNPLYMQTVGAYVDEIMHNSNDSILKNMYGEYRIPKILKLVDYYTKHDSKEEICNTIFDIKF